MSANVFGNVHSFDTGDVFGLVYVLDEVVIIPVCVDGQISTRLSVEHDVQTRLKVDGHVSTRLSVEMGRLICR